MIKSVCFILPRIVCTHKLELESPPAKLSQYTCMIVCDQENSLVWQGKRRSNIAAGRKRWGEKELE